MRKLLLTMMMIAAFCPVWAETASDEGSDAPKIVVGVIVDQMRWDYLQYYDYTFGDDGFRRLLREGYSCDNCLITYIPTVTAAGHSCVYSGSVPAITGIAGNNFYVNGKKTYCTDDSTVATVGGATDAGKMSPRNLRVTTMADAVKMSQNFKSKTIGVSLKDRGAILPAGHTADAAYWFDKAEGVFITSTYYMEQLPQWAADFNAANHPESDIRYTPTGNQLVADMAIAAIEGEGLGQGATTDFLAVSFSSTDYIGHRYGTRAPETEDVYRQLDRQIASLLNELDDKVGNGNYLLFLSADHAAAHNAEEMQAVGVPAGKWIESRELRDMNEYLQKAFSTSERLVKDYMEYRVYLDHEAIEGVAEEAEVKAKLLEYLRAKDQVAYAVDFATVATEPIPQVIRERIINGYNPKRSGDIQIILQPGYYGFGDDSYSAGTNHGVWCPYDSHIPLLFMGWHIPAGVRDPHEVHVTDIAATICSLLKVQVPDGCIGKPVVME